MGRISDMKNELLLRDVLPDDLPIFFEQQLDQEAITMAAFTATSRTNKSWNNKPSIKITEIQTVTTMRL
jgi:hypothetical protein